MSRHSIEITRSVSPTCARASKAFEWMDTVTDNSGRVNKGPFEGRDHAVNAQCLADVPALALGVEKKTPPRRRPRRFRSMAHGAWGSRKNSPHRRCPTISLDRRSPTTRSRPGSSRSHDTSPRPPSSRHPVSLCPHHRHVTRARCTGGRGGGRNLPVFHTVKQRALPSGLHGWWAMRTGRLTLRTATISCTRIEPMYRVLE